MGTSKEASAFIQLPNNLIVNRAEDKLGKNSHFLNEYF